MVETATIVTKESFRNLLASSMKISDETSGITGVSNSAALASDFFTKCALTCSTIWNIINPKPSDDFPEYKTSLLLAPDFASAYVLIRSLYENLLNMNYVLIDPRNSNEKDFRYRMWKRHTLAEKLELANNMPDSDELKQEVKELNQKRTDLENEIYKSNYFNSLPKPDQQSIKDSSKWTKLKSNDLADLVKIPSSVHNFLYKYLSNYSHSEGLSLEQIGGTRSPEEAKLMEGPIVLHAEMLLARTLDLFQELQPEAKKIIDENKELKERISKWKLFKK